jgi:hypothetical protein
MKSRIYAREITKEYLKKLGVEHVSEDGMTIIVKGKELTPHSYYSGKRHYKGVNLYDPAIRESIPKEERNSSSGQFRLGVHIANYVWNVADKPAGMVIDHIDNNSINNHISNLQCITPKENVNKDKDSDLHIRVVYMPQYITEEEILRKLEGYSLAYEEAKKNHDAKAAHLMRCNISNWRAKHRQYLESPEKYAKPKKVEHDCHARAEKRRELQANIDSARKYYKEALDAYGKDDEYVKKLWGEWKLAIAMLHGFKEETKKTAATIS